MLRLFLAMLTFIAFADAGTFLDKDLEQLLSQKKDGVIYLWSPHMEVSVQELLLIHQKMAAFKGKLHIMMDPNADLEYGYQILDKNKLPREYAKTMQSKKLVSSGVLIHFPTTTYFRGGKITKMIPGFSGVSYIVKALNE